MSFLVDTDVGSAFLEQNAVVFNRFNQHAGQLSVSTVALAELLTWSFRAGAPVTRLHGLLSMISDFHVVAIDLAVARRFGMIRAQLLDRGPVVPTADVLIAATALEHNLTLVTHNLNHYNKIPSLPIEGWLSP